MKKILVLSLAAMMFIAIVLTAGCTGTGGQDITQLRIGYQPSTDHLAHTTAMEKGWWKEDLAPYGITTVTDTLFQSGPPEMQAMLAGEIDIAYTGAAPVISAMSTGLDAKIVAAAQTQGSALVLRPDINYSSPQDLKGLTIATFPPGSIQDTLLRNWLKENGIDPAKDVTIKGMGPGDATTAITAGQVDGIFLPSPSPAIVVNEGNGKIAITSGEMSPNHACCVVIASGKLIREHPEIVEQVVRTHMKATGYIYNNTNETADIFAAKTGMDPAQVKLSMQDWDGAWVSDPNLIVDSVMEYVEIQHELGYLQKPLTQGDIFDLSFYEKARA